MRGEPVRLFVWVSLLNNDDGGSSVQDSESDFADLLRGAQAIADYTNENYRQAVYKLSTKQIPGWKIGTTWYSTKSKIRARLLGEDGDAQASSNGGGA
jgi:hypothetical protein